MGEIRKERRQCCFSLGHVRDWLLLLVEGKECGEGQVQ